jgi:hypothetical protein
VAVDASDACVLDGAVCALDYGTPLDFGGQAALWAAGEFHRDHDPRGGRQGLAVIGRANPLESGPGDWDPPLSA